MIIQIDMEGPDRAPYEEIAQMGAGGASPRGSTFWKRAQSCPREHLLSNVLRWEKTPRARALDIGLLWHGILETYYRAVHLEQQGVWQEVSPGQQAFRFLQRFRDEEGWGEFYETCSRMMDRYLERWRDNQDWQILGVEVTLGWTAETHPGWVRQLGFEITTRLDLLVIDWSLRGQPFTRHVEHKSSHSLDPLTVQGYNQDDQVLGQCFLARYAIDYTNLPPYLGALVNITTKGKEPKCERVPVQPSDQALQAWAEAKRDAYRELARFAERGYPKNYTQCTRRFGRCQHFDLCRANPLVDAATLLRADEEGALPTGYRKNETLPEEE